MSVHNISGCIPGSFGSFLGELLGLGRWTLLKDAGAGTGTGMETETEMETRGLTVCMRSMKHALGRGALALAAGYGQDIYDSHIGQ